jgi:hypothetical protein
MMLAHAHAHAMPMLLMLFGMCKKAGVWPLEATAAVSSSSRRPPIVAILYRYNIQGCRFTAAAADIF